MAGEEQRRLGGEGAANTPRAAIKAQAKFQVSVTMATKRFYFTACDADLMDFVMGAMCRFKCTSRCRWMLIQLSWLVLVVYWRLSPGLLSASVGGIKTNASTCITQLTAGR